MRIVQLMAQRLLSSQRLMRHSAAIAARNQLTLELPYFPPFGKAASSAGSHKTILDGEWKLQIDDHPSKTWLLNLKDDPSEHLLPGNCQR